MSPRSLLPGLLAVLAGALTASLAVPRPPLPPAKGYDLRGPALPRGLKLTVKRTASMKDGDMEVDAGAGKMAWKVSFAESSEKEVELLAVEGRQPTRLNTRLVAGEQTVSYSGMGAPPEVKQANPLAGLTVRSSLEKDAKGRRAWKHDLEKGEPGAGQKAFFERVVAWSPEDGLFPARRARVGDTWDIGTKDLTTFPGGGMKMKGFRAKGKGTLRAVEKYQGEMCALVEITLTVQGTQQTGGLDLALEAVTKTTTYRSLARGLNLKATSETTIKASADSPKVRLVGQERAVTTVTVKGG